MNRNDLQLRVPQGGDNSLRYVEGDFPQGTLARRDGAEVWLSLPARWWFFHYTKKLPLKGNVLKVEILQPAAKSNPLPNASHPVNRGIAAATQIANQFGAAKVGEMISGVVDAVSEWGVFDNRPVIYTCTLKDGRTFIAQSSMRHYRWLVNETLLHQSVTRFQNFDFADATMAASALMAFVDGEVTPAEIQKVEAAIASHEVLRSLPAEELKGRFTFYCDQIGRNAQWGYEQAMAAVKKLAGKEEQARALVHIIIDIGQANDFFGSNQQNFVRNVCGALGIYPGEFGLYYT